MNASTEIVQSTAAKIEAYVGWREECCVAWGAYRRWSAAPSADADLAFATYRAALDRGGQATDVYARVAGRVTELMRRHPELAAELPAGAGAYGAEDSR